MKHKRLYLTLNFLLQMEDFERHLVDSVTSDAIRFSQSIVDAKVARDKVTAASFLKHEFKLGHNEADSLKEALGTLIMSPYFQTSDRNKWPPDKQRAYDMARLVFMTSHLEEHDFDPKAPPSIPALAAYHHVSGSRRAANKKAA